MPRHDDDLHAASELPAMPGTSAACRRFTMRMLYAAYSDADGCLFDAPAALMVLPPPASDAGLMLRRRTR